MKINAPIGKISSDFNGTLILVFAQYIFFAIVTAMLFDGGFLSKLLMFSSIAYIVMLIMILIKRSTKPTKTDILLAQWGPTLLFVLTIFLNSIIGMLGSLIIK